MASKVQSAAMVVGAGALWGIMGVASRYLLEHDVSGYQIIFCRALVTSLVLFAILCRVDRSKIRIDARDTWMFLGSGVCGLTAFNLCYFSALPTLSLSMATVLLYTAPVYVTVISLFVFNEKMTRYKAVALVAAILGCVFTTGVLGDAQGDTVGVLFGILAGFFYSLYTLFGAFALKKYSPMTFTAYTFLFAGLATYPLSDLGSIQDLLRKDILVPFFLILIGVLFTLVPFFLYSKGLQNLDPGVAAVLAYTEPMVATVVGFMVYDEPITAFAVIGILLILTSIVLLSYGDKMPALEEKVRREIREKGIKTFIKDTSKILLLMTIHGIKNGTKKLFWMTIHGIKNGTKKLFWMTIHGIKNLFLMIVYGIKNLFLMIVYGIKNLFLMLYRGIPRLVHWVQRRFHHHK